MQRRMVVSLLAAIPLLSGATEALRGSAALAQGGLERYRWQNRVLIISVASANDPMLSQQRAILRAGRSGLVARDMVVFVQTSGVVQPFVGDPPAGPLDQFISEGLRFEALLIGKDGGVKGRWREPVSLNTLFEMIDRMPMRRREMQERGQ